MKFRKCSDGAVVNVNGSAVVSATGRVTTTAAGLTRDELLEAFEEYDKPAAPDPSKLRRLDHEQFAAVDFGDGEIVQFTTSAQLEDWLWAERPTFLPCRIWLEVL